MSSGGYGVCLSAPLTLTTSLTDIIQSIGPQCLDFSGMSGFILLSFWIKIQTLDFWIFLKMSGFIQTFSWNVWIKIQTLSIVLL